MNADFLKNFLSAFSEADETLEQKQVKQMPAPPDSRARPSQADYQKLQQLACATNSFDACLKQHCDCWYECGQPIRQDFHKFQNDAAL